jgi:hypothetical protein
MVGGVEGAMLTILQGDALDRLRELPSESVQCCVTSPPYWGLRDYGTAEWEGGDAECSHGAPVESGVSTNKSNSQTHPGRFVDCKCGARRIDAQLGLEATPDCGRAGQIRLRRDLSEDQLKFVAKRLVDAGLLYVPDGDNENKV